MSYGSGPTQYPAGQPSYGAPQQFGTPALSPDIAPLPGASIGEAIKRFFQRYAQFRGYASRSEYWWPWLVNFIISFTLSLFTTIPAIQAVSEAMDAAQHGVAVTPTYPSSFYIVSSIASIFSLVILLPSLSSLVRRLHDTGKSGFWIFIWLVPIAGPIWLLVLLASESRPDLYRAEWN
ncbi:DUF805 domain-containing protein [Actinomyces viscosus]|uniref:Inner membrane protein yhaH n=1 Tax=Actinomyces viscosus TaxID=1656 RepID=A0A448PJ96_ACTVI|nr:DUF805 domain-containing protein [Actinomyces viscosus]TFH51238.1 DUF805 domain-containing protein [Actinomyces viscosus]VEI15026.1 Inner membrane protein yhaH [Actinomyces viscosus]